MNALQVLSQNSDFLMGSYNLKGMMTGFMLILLVDTLFKGWALWRAARMKKVWWFISILLVNSAGIFPVIFLMTTNGQYQKLCSEMAIKSK